MPRYSPLQKCPECKKQYIPDLAFKDNFANNWIRWVGKDLIQDVWPSATSEQREQLQTGICDDACWEKRTGGNGL